MHLCGFTDIDFYTLTRDMPKILWFQSIKSERDSAI